MRLPRYARGLQIARFGVFGMLVMLALSIALAVKTVTASTERDAMDIIDYAKYTQWANLAAVGAMLAGMVLAVPDFRAARMSLVRIAISIACFGVTLLVLWQGYRLMSTVVDAALSGDLEALAESAEDLESLPMLTVVKDIAYTLGLVMIVRTIRQTAVANDHDALRDAASTVSGLIAGMLVFDIIFQLLFGMGNAGVTFALIGLLLGLGVFVYWVYCHLRLAKFLKAASILVHEPHNLPVARVVSSGEPVARAPIARPSATSARRSGAMARPVPVDAVTEPSGPVARPSIPVAVADAPSAPRLAPTASQPIIPVAAELRQAPAPRATSHPGAHEPDGPKFLK